MIRVTRIVRVVDSSEVAQARRVASQCSEAMGLSDTAAGRVALLTTELATNLVKHGGGGSILFGSDDVRAKTMHIMAIDKGRGIASVPTAMSDGYSTSGSPGTGLGAMTRSAASLDLYTLPDKGTVITCTIDDEPVRTHPVPAPRTYPIAGICLPKAGESAFGDSWAAHATNDVVTLMLADGLGHGPLAETASTAAVRVFSERPELPLEHLLQELHGALRPTRGAAVGLARIYVNQRRVEFAGAGNIAGTIAADGGTRKTVSLPGIVGHEMRKLQTFTYPWEASSVLILQSDGLSANWSAASYPGLLQKDAATIAAVLYRDHCRGNDDATVVVAKTS